MNDYTIESRLAKHLQAHRDNLAVDEFASAMKNKMAQARLKGHSGWQQCTSDHLMAILHNHVEKGDMRDVANIAMMLWHNTRKNHEIR